MFDKIPVIKVKEVFIGELTFVMDDDSLSTCLPHFKTKMSHALIVLDTDGKYTGILNQRSIRRSKLDPSSMKVKALMRSAPLVQLNDSIGEAARLMIENQIMQIPVFAGKKLKGLITSDRIIESIVDSNYGQMRIEQIMTKNPLVISQNDSVGEVLNLFKEHGISHAPVTHDDRLRGIVSIQDIIDVVYRSRSRQTKGERVGEKVDITNIIVNGIMRYPVVTISPEDTLKICWKKMFDYNVSCLVVARNDKVLGIVTKKDFLELFAQATLQTRRFTVQFSVKPDVRIAQGDRKVMMKAYKSFTERYKEVMGSGTLFVYIKCFGSASKSRQLVQCRFQFRTTRGLFYSSSEAWSSTDAFLLALDRLERRVLQSKEMELNPEYVRRHIEDHLSSEIMVDKRGD